MHNNYYFLKQVSAQLSRRLIGFTCVSCFSQNKDELIVEFNNSKESFFIKASLQPAFSCLSFPKHFARARKNSIDIFNQLLMKQVIAVRQFENERSFCVVFEDSLSLLFKMHGNRANAILCEHDYAISLFKNHLIADREIILSTLDRTIDFSKENFLLNRQNLQATYFTFGKWAWKYLEDKNFNSLHEEEQWNQFSVLKTSLESPAYFVVEQGGNFILSLLPLKNNIIKQIADPLEAITDFFHTYSLHHAFQSEKSLLKKQLQEQLRAGQSYVLRNQEKLNKLLNDTHYQQWGDLLMAYMHEIKTGAETITLTDFYTGRPTEIKLKKDLSPQKNAEVFYRKAKNQQIEITKLKESVEVKLNELKKLTTELEELEATNDLKRIRSNFSKVEPKGKSSERSIPYYEFEFKGFKILVGRNAESNDVLTLKLAYKEDLWLHAKDVAGSHVIIKHQSGKSFPKDVIERAAQLAAYNSKRKTDTLCPVAFTPKKYVRKRKGDPAGAVIVDREEVIMVEPKL